MTKEQFIEKYRDPIVLGSTIYGEAKGLKQFESDLNSLFNLRTETRTREEVRDLIAEYDRKIENSLSVQRTQITTGLRDLCKWFLKE